ncbi:MAG: flippase [Planctomycetota bacterium]
MSNKSLHRRLSLRANVSWTFFANVFNSACWLAMTIVLAKLGSPADVGQFAIGLATTAPIFLFATLRLRDVQATDVEQTYEFSDYFALRMITTLLAMAAVAVLLSIANYEAETKWVILATAVSKSVESIGDCIHGLFMHYERLDRVAKAKILRGPLALVGLTIAFALTGSVFVGVLGIVAARFLVLLTYEGPLAIATIRHWSKSNASTKTERVTSQFWPRWRGSTLKRLMWLALPLGFVQLLNSLNVNIPRYFVDAELGAYSLGLFAAVAAFQKVAPTVVQAVGLSATPRLAKHYAEGDARAFRTLTRRLLGIAILLGVGGVAIAALFGKPILTLVYGPEYALPGLFMLVMVGAGANYLASMLVYTITSARRFRIQLPLHLLSSISVAVVCFWLVPRMGLNGAAIGLIAGSLVRALGSLVIVLQLQRSLDSSKTSKNSASEQLVAESPNRESDAVSQIELVGTTCAGKSTFASLMSEAARDQPTKFATSDVRMLQQCKLSEHTPRAIRVFIVHWLSLMACLRDPKRSASWIRRGWIDLREVNTPLWRKCNQLRKITKQLGRHLWVQRHSEEGVVLVDEGTLHSAHNLFVHTESELDPNLVGRFAEAVPLPDLVIHMSEEDETLIERTMKRGHGRINSDDKDEVTRFVTRASRTFDLLHQHPRIASRTLLIHRGEILETPDRWFSAEWDGLRQLITDALRMKNELSQASSERTSSELPTMKEAKEILPC